jgi:geranylgeranyl diphosphate synthase type 3
LEINEIFKIYSGSDYTPLVNIIGIHFQVRDDYMNLQSTEVRGHFSLFSTIIYNNTLYTKYTHNKGFCEDLTEGKFSFPIIHAIRTDMSNRQLLNILSQKTNSLEVKQYAVQVIKGTGAFEYTLEFLKQKEKEALEEIERLGGNPLLEQVIKHLSLDTLQDK